MTRACADLIVFMNPVAPQGELDAVTTVLGSDPAVVAFTYADHQVAFAEFRALFSDEPHENLGPGNIEAGDLPTSYRLRLLETADPTAERERYKALTGVKELTFD